MTSQAVFQTAIEDALIARFQGISVVESGFSVPVSVFMEEPAVEEVAERTYPSVTMMYLGEVPDFGIRDSDDDEEFEEVGYDPVPPVNTREMRPVPEATKLQYSIDTWNKTRAQVSRDLLFQAVRKKIKPRTYLTVKNVDGEDIDLWMFWRGGLVPNHERYPDMIVYHFSLTVEILAYMAVVDNSETTDEKVAMEIQWKVFSKKVDESTGDALDVEIGIDENNVGPI
jgi:hypothetical protein